MYSTCTNESASWQSECVHVCNDVYVLITGVLPGASFILLACTFKMLYLASTSGNVMWICVSNLPGLINALGQERREMYVNINIIM